MEILRARQEDTEEIYRIMIQAGALIEDKGWYCTDTKDYVKEHVENEARGFVLKAVEDRRIAAFFLIHYPGHEADSLGHYMNLNESELLKVAYMDSLAVSPDFRGRGLQYALMAQGEQILAGTPFCHLMGTVHPDNIYSLNNFLKLGYKIVTTTYKYGSLPRNIMYKQI